MKKYNITSKLINNWGVMYVDWTREEMIETYQIKELEGLSGICINRKTNTPIIWAENNDIFVINHEVSHAIFQLFRLIGIPITEDTEEVHCLMHQYFYKEILKRLKLVQKI